jgi:hypothetical protein
MSSKQNSTMEVACPDCGATLKIDVAMREQDERKESIFRQSVEAHKNNNDVLEKKFAEAVRKAKETPDTGKPLRDFDLD